MISKLFCRFSFATHRLSTPEANANLLKEYGITKPQIYRNLTYDYFLI